MAMKRYTPEEIVEVRRLHEMWCRDEEGGQRADFSGANLRCANLVGANLRCANLDGANLRCANLRCANLDGANLRCANLVGANLRCANLDGANLDGANLRCANLDGANLDGANLRCANLDGANLDGAKGYKKFISIGPIGSRNGYTQCYLAEDRIVCGCFDGSLERFEAKVRKTHAGNPVHLASYLALVVMVKAVREAQPPAVPAAPEPTAPFAKDDMVQLNEAARAKWPWAPTSEGRVLRCEGGWTLLDYPSCYLNAPYGFLEPAAVAAKEAV
jgi:hypothetical protein